MPTTFDIVFLLSPDPDPCLWCLAKGFPDLLFIAPQISELRTYAFFSVVKKSRLSWKKTSKASMPLFRLKLEKRKFFRSFVRLVADIRIAHIHLFFRCEKNPNPAKKKKKIESFNAFISTQISVELVFWERMRMIPSFHPCAIMRNHCIRGRYNYYHGASIRLTNQLVEYWKGW